MGPQLRQHVSRPQGSRSRFVSLVAGASPGSFHRLLHRIDRKQAETDREPVAHRHLSETSGSSPRDVIEVGRVAPDDRSECHQA